MYSRTNLKAWLVILVVLLAVLPGSVLATGTYDDGDGSAGEPFQINTPAQMDEIGQHSEDWDKCFILTADIDLSDYTGTDFHIIGTSYNNLFTGVFDGNDHAISNFSYTSTDVDHIAIFGYVGTGGELKNLGLLNVNIDAGTGWYVGGLVGLNLGQISNCYACGNVTGTGDNVGGLVGWNWNMVSNCYATGNVFGSGSVGGLVGWNDGGSTVSKCYATGTVTGEDYVGGLVGGCYGTVSDCYAAGTVSGVSWVGGLMGLNLGQISDCYATGNVSGGRYVGGLVGLNWYGTISSCYATGSVTGEDYVGGLVGYDGSGSYTSCFWDSDVNPVLTGIGNMTDPPEVMGRTTAEMKTQSTFTDYGWDFVEIWDIGENQTYPYLRVYPAGDLNHDGRVDFEDFAIFADNWLAGM